MNHSLRVWLIMIYKQVSIHIFFFILCILTLEPVKANLPADSSSLKGLSENQIILDRVRNAITHPNGLEFTVEWYYKFDDDEWFGEGLLSILGKDFLKLILPFQETLIKESTIMIRYPETDQVIIDYFDREDPTNLFAIFMGEFDHFFIQSVEKLSDSVLVLYLLSETLVGFEKLKLTIDQKSWLPTSIFAEAGEDIQVSIRVKSVSTLLDPELLRNATLSGKEIIDLRE